MKVSGVIVLILILLVGVMLRRRNKKEVADFFAALTRTDDIHAFKPREFIEAGEHVTVLGWENSSA